MVMFTRGNYKGRGFVIDKKDLLSLKDKVWLKLNQMIYKNQVIQM